MKEFWLYFESYTGKTVFKQIQLPCRVNEADYMDDIRELMFTDPELDTDYKIAIVKSDKKDIEASLNKCKIACMKLPERIIENEDGSLTPFDPSWN